MANIGGICYLFFMSPTTRTILERVAQWPEEDQNELADIARQIEARRSGEYAASSEELSAIDEADGSGVATEEEVQAAYRAFRSR